MRRQEGFSLVIAFIVLAVVTGLVVGGWYVWNKSHDRPKSSSQITEKVDGIPGAAKSTRDKYLVIKEWQLKIPLDNNISEAYYEFNSNELADYVSLYDASFDKLKNANNIPCKDGEGSQYQFYSISRAKLENVEALSEGAAPHYQSFPFSTEYMFGGLGAHQAAPPCVNLNPDPYGELHEDLNIGNIAERKERAFDNAFKKLEPAHD